MFNNKNIYKYLFYCIIIKRAEMRFNINFEKKHGLLFILIFSIVLAGFVFAAISPISPQWPNPNTHMVWHNANDTKVGIGGLNYTLQELINEGWFVNKNMLTDIVNSIIAIL